MSRTFAVIPAAGKSRRMGKPKLSLPLGDTTVLEAVVTAVTQGGVYATLVVIGPGDNRLRELAEKAGASVLELVEETAHMRETVERGLEWVEKRYQPVPEDGFLLLPADHPCVDKEVVKQLLSARVGVASPSIIVPVFESRRGHPVRISWKHVGLIRTLPPGEGLNSYLRRQADETLEVPVATPSVLWDLDTEEDYRRLQAAI